MAWNQDAWGMSLQQADYQNIPHENVDWATLARQWIQQKDDPTDSGTGTNAADSNINAAKPPPQVPVPNTSAEHPHILQSNGFSASLPPRPMPPAAYPPTPWPNMWPVPPGTGWTSNVWTQQPRAPPPPPPPTVSQKSSVVDYVHGQSTSQHSFDYEHGSSATDQQFAPAEPNVVPPAPHPAGWGNYWPPAGPAPTPQQSAGWAGAGHSSASMPVPPQTAVAPYGDTSATQRRYEQTGVGHYEFDPAVIDFELDAARRRSLPPWIREGLEKMERDKQKQAEKAKVKQQHAEILRMRKEEQLNEPSAQKTQGGENVSSSHGTFDSDRSDESEDDDAPDRRFSEGSDFKRSSSPGFVTKKFKTEEELRQEMVRTWLTEILLEVTDHEIQHVAREVYFRQKAKDTQRQVRNQLSSAAVKTSALSALASFGDDIDSDVDDAERSEESDSGTDSDAELQESLRLRLAAWNKRSADIHKEIVLLEEEERDAIEAKSRAFETNEPPEYAGPADNDTPENISDSVKHSEALVEEMDLSHDDSAGEGKQAASPVSPMPKNRGSESEENDNGRPDVHRSKKKRKFVEEKSVEERVSEAEDSEPENRKHSTKSESNERKRHRRRSSGSRSTSPRHHHSSSRRRRRSSGSHSTSPRQNHNSSRRSRRSSGSRSTSPRHHHSSSRRDRRSESLERRKRERKDRHARRKERERRESKSSSADSSVRRSRSKSRYRSRSRNRDRSSINQRRHRSRSKEKRKDKDRVRHPEKRRARERSRSMERRKRSKSHDRTQRHSRKDRKHHNSGDGLNKRNMQTPSTSDEDNKRKKSRRIKADKHKQSGKSNDKKKRLHETNSRSSNHKSRRRRQESDLSSSSS